MADYKSEFMRYMDNNGVKYQVLNGGQIRITYNADNMKTIPIIVFFDEKGNNLVEFICFQIATFKDDKSLQKGESISRQLLQAIKDARLSIVVFSKDYASSTWCLDEMAAIHECRSKLNRTVIPVFYNVEPSHVRMQARHLKLSTNSSSKKVKYVRNKVDQWRKAMWELSNLAGFVVRDK